MRISEWGERGLEVGVWGSGVKGSKGGRSQRSSGGGIRGDRGQGSRWWGLTPSTPKLLTPPDPGSKEMGSGVKGSKGGRSQGKRVADLVVGG